MNYSIFGYNNSKDLIGGIGMSRNNKSIMPESDKEEIAKELGVYDKVKKDGWGSVSSKDCGNIVKKSMERIEKGNINK